MGKYVPVGIAYALWPGIGVGIVSLAAVFAFTRSGGCRHDRLVLSIAGMAAMLLFSHTMEL
ncbi:hypothetical protein [Desulfovibrio sp.]